MYPNLLELHDPMCSDAADLPPSVASSICSKYTAGSARPSRGLRWESRALRLSRIQPRLHLPTAALQGLHDKSEEFIVRTQNTFKEEVSFGLQAARRLWC